MSKAKPTRVVTVVDLFCGAGGTSTGAQGAVDELNRRRPEVNHTLRLLAVNHWDKAIESHNANHPDLDGLCRELGDTAVVIDAVDPVEVAKTYGEIDLLCASPECIFYSNARAGKPKVDAEGNNGQQRIDAWFLIDWVNVLRPAQLLIENVPEFQKWGPDKVVGHEVDAHGNNVVLTKPDKAHAGETYNAFVDEIRQLGYRVEDNILTCADYGDPTTRRRLFLRAARIDTGRERVLWPRPSHSKDGAVDPEGHATAPWRGARECIDFSKPSKSIFTHPKYVKKPLVDATLARIWRGVVDGLKTNGFEVLDCDAFTLPQDKRAKPRSVNQPLSTVATAGAISVVQPSITPVDGPVPQDAPTLTVRLVEPFIVASNGERKGQKPRVRSTRLPVPTVTASGRVNVCEPFIVTSRRNATQGAMSQPLPTITAGGTHHGLCEPFLVSYYGTGHDHPVDDPLPTVTTKERFALVTVRNTETGVENQFKIDLLFRMLAPDELAKAQGFPADYHFAGSKKDQTKQIGNAVPVNTAKALCLAALTNALLED